MHVCFRSVIWAHGLSIGRATWAQDLRTIAYYSRESVVAKAALPVMTGV